MATAHRIVALIQARRLEQAQEQLHRLGLAPGDVHVEPFPLPEGAPPAHPASPPRSPRGRMALASAAGAVPGALAGLAITLGTGAGLMTAAGVIAIGAVIGTIAATGRGPRHGSAKEAEVLRLDRRDYLRIDARCRDSLAPRARQLLREAGATLIEPSTPRLAPPRTRPAGGFRSTPRHHGRHLGRPTPGRDGHTTPPQGFERMPTPDA